MLDAATRAVEHVSLDTRKRVGMPQDEDKTNYCNTCGGRWVANVKQYVKDVKYGEVRITVHDGNVVQVEKTEKLRF